MINSLFVQNATVSDILQTILTFIYFLAHQIGLGVVKLIQTIFTRSTFSVSIIDSLGFLIILTLFIFLTGISRRIAWIIVGIAWILLFIGILMIIFKVI
jgi:hypothetical protein